MRASWDPELKVQDTYSISGDRFHHLVNVVRLEQNEELLLLNGKGLQVKTKVEGIFKRELRLSFVSTETVERKFTLDLALGIPKKDALDLSLKEATELGFRRIFLVRSEYSQTKVPDKERLTNLLSSALEQSNSPFMPEIVEASWSDLSWEDYDYSLMMDSQSEKRQNNDLKQAQKVLLIVGPEGGFSSEELSYLHSRSRQNVVRLDTPILRTPTAVATGAGIILGRLLDR